MAISIKKARKIINGDQKVTDSIDILNEINNRRFKYQSTAIVAGKVIEVRYYEKFIFTNYSASDFDDEKDSEPSKPKKSSSDSTDPVMSSSVSHDENSSKKPYTYSSLSPEKKSEKNAYRSNIRRGKKIRNIVMCNAGTLDKFITLTMGQNDYAGLVRSELKTLEQPIPTLRFTTSDLKKLEGIKDISRCSPDKDSKLNPEDEALRIRVVDFLGHNLTTGKKERTKNKVYETYRDQDLTKSRLNQKLKRELYKQLNSMICNKDPFDIDDAYDLFRYFVEKVNRYIEKEGFSNDSNRMEYVKITELQKSGRVHFHMLCNIPYIDQWELQTLWGNGIVNVKTINNMTLNKKDIEIREDDDLENKYGKITSYFSKEAASSSSTKKLKNRQLFTSSKGLRNPLQIRSVYLLDIILEYMKKNGISPAVDRYYKPEKPYAKSYRQKIYNLKSFTLYDKISGIIKKLTEEMIAVAEQRGQKRITQDIFDQIIETSPLAKDFRQG